MNVKHKIVAITAATAAIAAPTSILAATPASAQSNCGAGTWGGIHGWGDCRGSGKWQLQLSCTWGASTTSGVLNGPGHVDLQCPYGSARNAQIIFL